MRNALTHRLTRSRRRWWMAAVMVVATGVALSASVVQGRVDPVSTQQATAAMRRHLAGLLLAQCVATLLDRPELAPVQAS